MSNRVPPQATDIEKAIIGIILIEKEAINTANELLRPEMFYSTANQMVFSAFTELHNKNQPIDFLTVTDYLKARGELSTIGGAYYLTDATNAVVSSAHLERHCKRVVEKYILRELIKVSGETYTKAFDETQDPFELMEQFEKYIHSLSLNLNQKDYSRIDDTLIQIAIDLEEKRHRDQSLTGIPTGFRDLDRTTCGWQPQNLVILAARPKCGKTAMALQLALNSAMEGEGVGFFSMEMSAQQLVKRLLSNKASMYLQTLRDARLDDAQMVSLYQNGIQKLSGIPFFIDDTAALSVAEFKAKARRMVKANKVKFLVIDYLQLMQPEKGKKNQNREQEIATIARQLKICAKELNVPILSLSQLSREVEKRAGNVPQLSDLRESGSLEQDADIVMFLYKPTEAEVADDRSKENLITLKIAAFRDGEPKSIEFEFDGKYQRFSEKGYATVANLTPLKTIENEGFPGSSKKFTPLKPTGTDDEDPF
jgi:replicative DNA helicase